MTSDNRYYRKVVCLIGVALVIRCILAFTVNLGNDEAYYFTYAIQPDWNHFDHPPLVGIFIRIFTLDLHWINDLSMRLTSIVAAALCTWIIFQCGCVIKNERAGWIASILYNVSVYTSIISGLFIIPDSPQLVFWLLTVLIALKLLLATQTKKQQSIRIMLIGACIGLATMCKIHGLFLWFGIGIYILLYDRRYLKNPFLYLSFMVTLAIISPIFLWNLQNHFITWRFHSQRVEIHHVLLNPSSFVTALAGQILYNNPVNIIIYVIALPGLKKTRFPQGPLHLLRWFSFPIIIVVTAISLFRNVLPHWSGPGFIGLMLISSVVWDEYFTAGKARYCKRWLAAGGIFTATLIVLGVACVDLYPGTLGNKRAEKLGAGDVTLDMYGWRELSKDFKLIRQDDVRNGLMPKTAPIVINKWFPGGHLLYYVGYPLHVPVIGVGDLDDLHKFAWLNRAQGMLTKGENAYYITSSHYFKDPKIQYAGDFNRIVLIKKIAQMRSGFTARYWYIYRLEGAVRKLGDILPE